jgi:hypothetical protein
MLQRTGSRSNEDLLLEAQALINEQHGDLVKEHGRGAKEGIVKGERLSLLKLYAALDQNLSFLLVEFSEGLTTTKQPIIDAHSLRQHRQDAEHLFLLIYAYEGLERLLSKRVTLLGEGTRAIQPWVSDILRDALTSAAAQDRSSKRPAPETLLQTCLSVAGEWAFDALHRPRVVLEPEAPLCRSLAISAAPQGAHLGSAAELAAAKDAKDDPKLYALLHRCRAYDVQVASLQLLLRFAGARNPGIAEYLFDAEEHHLPPRLALEIETRLIDARRLYQSL